MGKKTIKQVDLSESTNTIGWYTIVTKFNYENKVGTDILKIMQNNPNFNIVEVFIPFKEIIIKNIDDNGKEKITKKNERILANYVFIKGRLDDHTWKSIMNITGVSAILYGAGDMPYISSDNEINKIKERCATEIIEGEPVL